ncbi:MAG: CopG family antitoxin [Anaerolineales bacterium]|jgi:Protein of unknown function (DUF3680).|nr:MAG: CopG family antitoxin [Anaerolineales bacterium]HPP62781.1 CopG family antitoxin [Anaerolineales bacterium]
MAKNKPARDPMPSASASMDEIINFWDTHSAADYEDEMTDANFDIDIQEESFAVAIVPELAEIIGRAAKARGVTTETLVNLWLSERVKEPA